MANHEVGAEAAAGVERFELIIAGGGPTGLTLAGLLGRAGLCTLLVEKSASVYPQPRAVGFDHDAMRIFQRAGVADQLAPFVEPFRNTVYLGVGGRIIRRVQPLAPPYPLSWPPSLTCDQPGLEGALRRNLEAMPTVTSRFGWEVNGFVAGDTGVSVRVDTPDGPRTFTSDYLIGCDGASSPVRRALGVNLSSMDYDAPWVVVDVDVDPAYLARLPDTNVQYCEPERPSTHIVCPGTHRRWEFMLLEGEQEGALDHAQLWRLLSRWLDPGQGRIRRAASYRFHALIAESWRAGRVLLAGDAAHQTPPFMGQGMCQGIRDVGNLAWKLVHVLRGRAGDGLLDSYADERAPHVERTTRIALELGHMMSERDIDAARARDERMAGGPDGARTLTRQDLIPGLDAGLIASGSPGAGEVFPQPRVRQGGAMPALFDDLAPFDWRLVCLHDPADVADAAAQLGISVFRVGTDPAGLTEEVPLLADWLKARGAIGALVRPDHYVYGCFADERGAHALLDHLRAALAAASFKERPACAT